MEHAGRCHKVLLRMLAGGTPMLAVPGVPGQSYNCDTSYPRKQT
jgi:hypothetical protein